MLEPIRSSLLSKSKVNWLFQPALGSRSYIIELPTLSLSWGSTKTIGRLFRDRGDAKDWPEIEYDRSNLLETF